MTDTFLSALALGLLLAFAPLIASADSNQSPRSVSNGPVRFQALTPTLLRLEYSAQGKFVDEPSVSVTCQEGIWILGKA